MVGTRYYLAARYERRPEMLQHAEVLAEFDHSVTSMWILGWGGENNVEAAAMCLYDLKRSNALIYFAGDTLPELEIALGLGMKIHYIGEPRTETMYDLLPQIHKYKDWNEFRCVVLESTLQTQEVKLHREYTNTLESSLSEQKSDQNKAIYQFPQPYSTDLQQNPSTFPQDQT